MAKHCIFFDFSIQNLVINCNIVNSFSRKNSFTKIILVNIGNRICVKINATLNAKQLHKFTLFCQIQFQPNSRLHNTITRNNAIIFNHWNIQNVVHRTNQLLRRFQTQIRIAIQRNNIFNFWQQIFLIFNRIHQKLIFHFAFDIFVERHQKTPFSLPTNIRFFASIPFSFSVQKMKFRKSEITIFLV